MRNTSDDSQIWANLREAIANSSGFQGWKQQQKMADFADLSLDKQVRLYLRDTLGDVGLLSPHTGFTS